MGFVSPMDLSIVSLFPAIFTSIGKAKAFTYENMKILVTQRLFVKGATFARMSFMVAGRTSFRVNITKFLTTIRTLWHSSFPMGVILSLREFVPTQLTPRLILPRIPTRKFFSAVRTMAFSTLPIGSILTNHILTKPFSSTRKITKHSFQVISLRNPKNTSWSKWPGNNLSAFFASREYHLPTGYQIS